MSLFDEEVRRQLRLSLLAAGTEPARADQAVDLACHAADRAATAFADVMASAPDGVIGTMMAEIGAQLVAGHFTRLFEVIHRLGQSFGVPSAETTVTLKGGLHG